MPGQRPVQARGVAAAGSPVVPELLGFAAGDVVGDVFGALPGDVVEGGFPVVGDSGGALARRRHSFLSALYIYYSYYIYYYYYRSVLWMSAHCWLTALCVSIHCVISAGAGWEA